MNKSAKSLKVSQSTYFTKLGKVGKSRIKIMCER